MSRDLRTWMEKLATEGELKRIKAKVGWDGEIAEIRRRVLQERGPALLFENIEGYENTWCRKLFTGELAGTRRVALMLSMPKDTPRPDVLQLLRKRLREPIEPVRLATGPVKENIVKGDDVDLFQIPVPKWHPLDAGRYINTWCGVVTMDPDTGMHNVGLYRGMLLDKDKIGVLLIPAKGWGIHYDRYRQMGKPMPVAVVYGWDPAMAMAAATPLTINEYEVMGAILQEPVPLCQCETSDIEVPCAAEIVVEGTISTETATYEEEGFFGEALGFYGERRKRPVIKVDCITFRNDPIYVGALTGISQPGVVSSDEVAITHMGVAATMWNTQESQGIPGVLDIVPMPVTAIKIHKTYQGQPKHVAAAIWGTRLAITYAKIIIVVEEDVDISDPAAILRAMLLHVDPARDLVVFPMGLGELDTAFSSEAQDELKWGATLGNNLLIDATVNWTTHPVREEWGGRRLPPPSTEPFPDMVELVEKRWKEYGL
ncbi:UbiD family decarboxylase [Chloroflexota bacterium]